MKTEMIDFDMVRLGDTLVLDGEKHTICRNNIKSDGFWCPTIKGQPVMPGKSIERVLFKKFYQGKLVGYVSQP